MTAPFFSIDSEIGGGGMVDLPLPFPRSNAHVGLGPLLSEVSDRSGVFLSEVSDKSGVGVDGVAGDDTDEVL